MTTTQERTILAWDDDPGAPPEPRRPRPHALPRLGIPPLAVGISGEAPPPVVDGPGTPEFRYWTAADALSRAAALWASILPGTTWNENVGATLVAELDAGDDLNAYYDRNGLKFFHHQGTDGTVYYSGESPDVVCHELGHAVLDAVRPQLWDAASSEVAAFHESFADISALLAALQLDAIRTDVITETRGQIGRSSRLSRLAEQLGYAIRQVAPQAVERDCLRNAANRFFYRDPLTLPPSAPASALSSEVHSFSRVFTGAYLRVIAGIFRATGKDSEALLAASRTAGQLLITGVSQAPVTSGYYAQVAAHVIAADQALNGGIHAALIRLAFNRHGILAPQAAATLSGDVLRHHAARFASFAQTGTTGGRLTEVEIDGTMFGIDGPVTVSIAAEPPRFAVAGAALAGGSVQPSEATVAANGFVEDLIRNDRVSLGGDAGSEDDARLTTHRLERNGSGRKLVRRLFD